MAIKKLCPFKLWTLQNFPFIAEDFDALTNYELMCKIVGYLNDVIDVTNNQTTAINELLTWFDNLDVQDEVNNKLDEMAESGELQEIISQYINTRAVLCFDTINALKSSSNLVNGSYARTLGYYSINDGGGSLFKVRTILNTDDISEGKVIPINNSNLVAELILNNGTISVKQFGARGNGTTDDTSAIQNALNYYGNYYSEVIFNKNETYLVNNNLYVYANTHVDLHNCTLKAGQRVLILNESNSLRTGGYLASQNISFKNGTINGQGYGVLFGFIHTSKLEFRNILFKDCSLNSHILDLGGCKDVIIDTCDFTGSYTNSSLSSLYYNEIIQIDFANNTALPYWGTSSSYVFDDLPTINVSVNNCTFSKGNGNFYPNAIGCHGLYGTRYVDNISITNNTFTGFTFSCIRFPRIQNIIINNNIFNSPESVSHDGFTRNPILLYVYANDETKVLKNITISDNKFYTSRDREIESIIKISGHAEYMAQNIYINNNDVIGNGTDGVDFVSISYVTYTNIVANVAESVKNFVYKVYDLGCITINDNDLNNCRDLISSNQTSDIVKQLTLDNNNIVINGNSVNTSDFNVQLGLTADVTGSVPGNRLPISILNTAPLFSVNSSYALKFPEAIRGFKVNGAIAIKNNGSNAQTYVLTVRELTNSTTPYNELGKVYYRIEAGQTGSLQIPTLLFKEDRLLASITHELLFTIAINNGDLFVADGTKIIVEEI